MWRICVGEGAEPLIEDYGDGLKAEDCVGKNVQQMTVDDTACFTQPSIVGGCTPQLHEIPTLVEDCGPSTRHEYVLLEVNPLHGVHDMMIVEFTDDAEEENTDYDNDVYDDDDDIHNDEVDDIASNPNPYHLLKTHGIISMTLRIMMR
jgi:superfamily II helicase